MVRLPQCLALRLVAIHTLVGSPCRFMTIVAEKQPPLSLSCWTLRREPTKPLLSRAPVTALSFGMSHPLVTSRLRMPLKAAETMSSFSTSSGKRLIKQRPQRIRLTRLLRYALLRYHSGSSTHWDSLSSLIPTQTLLGGSWNRHTRYGYRAPLHKVLGSDDPDRPYIVRAEAGWPS